MNGKLEPDDSTDQQCSHCGLWFDKRGINSHVRHCPLKDCPHTIQDAGGKEQTGGDPPEPETPSTEPSPGDGDGDGADPAARTDGGPGLGLSGPDVDDTTVDDLDQGHDSNDDPSPEECPTCGSADYYDADELREAAGDELTEEQRQATIEHDRICSDCEEAYR